MNLIAAVDQNWAIGRDGDQLCYIPADLKRFQVLTTGHADPAAVRDELLHTMACKAAIKGGWKTSPQELERVAQAVMDGSVKYCPHGRPVAIELTRKEWEKQFKRA